MAFVILFVLTTLAFPLAVEIYEKGSDNLIVRSGQEVKNVAVRSADATGSFVSRAVIVAVLVAMFLVMLWVNVWIGLMLLQFIMRGGHL